MTKSSDAGRPRLIWLTKQFQTPWCQIIPTSSQCFSLAPPALAHPSTHPRRLLKVFASASSITTHPCHRHQPPSGLFAGESEQTQYTTRLPPTHSFLRMPNFVCAHLVFSSLLSFLIHYFLTQISLIHSLCFAMPSQLST